MNHWIDEALVEGVLARTAPVFKPAIGLQSGDVDVADRAVVAIEGEVREGLAVLYAALDAADSYTTGA